MPTLGGIDEKHCRAFNCRILYGNYLPTVILIAHSCCTRTVISLLLHRAAVLSSPTVFMLFAILDTFTFFHQFLYCYVYTSFGLILYFTPCIFISIIWYSFAVDKVFIKESYYYYYYYSYCIPSPTYSFILAAFPFLSSGFTTWFPHTAYCLLPAYPSLLFF